MENLNAEQIKKALGYCKSPKLTKCYGCPREQEDGHCMYRLNEDALALINSQEQRIKELEQCWEHEHASAMEIFGQYGEKCDRLTEENERLSQSLANISQSLANSKADTVRKMQERLDKRFCHDPAFLGVEQRLIMDVIDQIAKELTEDGNG